MSELILISFYGIIAGAVYSVLHFFVILFNRKKVLYIITDTLSSVAGGLLFVYCVINECNGIIRLYTICAFLLGILIVIISIGNLLDFFAIKVYNIVEKMQTKLGKIKKNKRGKRHESRPVKQTS